VIRPSFFFLVEEEEPGAVEVEVEDWAFSVVEERAVRD
jgi:hypothetical protein